MSPAETQHVADFALEWDSAVSKNAYLDISSAPVITFAPAEVPPSASNFSHVGCIDKEFSFMVDQMSSAQIDELLDACCNSDNVAAAVPPLLSFNLNVAEVMGAEDSKVAEPSEEELERLASWPAFEPEVGPRISSVASWTACHVAEAPVKEVSSSQQSYFGSDNEEWGGDSYRALAQLLIEAARQTGTTEKELTQIHRTIPSSIPQGRRVYSAKIRHGAKGPEFQDRLRTLFSERA
jgi:hypothetical protein